VCTLFFWTTLLPLSACAIPRREISKRARPFTSEMTSKMPAGASHLRPPTWAGARLSGDSGYLARPRELVRFYRRSCTRPADFVRRRGLMTVGIVRYIQMFRWIASPASNGLSLSPESKPRGRRTCWPANSDPQESKIRGRVLSMRLTEMPKNGKFTSFGGHCLLVADQT